MSGNLDKQKRRDGENELKFITGTYYTTDQQLLFDLRKYLKIIVFLQCVFVSVVVLTFGLAWSQISKYDFFRKASMNSLNENIQGVMMNANSMSTLAAPIVGNLQYLTNAMVAAVFANMNSTTINTAGLAARSKGTSTNGQRHLLDVPVVQNDFTINENDLMKEDYKLRKMIYNHARDLMEHADDQLTSFNMSSVSDLLSFVVHGVDYSSIYDAFDRVMTDAEKVANFGVLASAMLGLASQMANTSLPSVSDMFGAYGQQAAAANDAKGNSGGSGSGCAKSV